MRIPEPKSTMDDIEQCRSYNTHASNPESLNEYVNLYTELIGISTGSVVDLGSGSCNFVIALAQAFPKLNFVCYESSSAMIEIAIENITKNNLENRITIIQDDLLTVCGKYDVVLSNRVLHHIEDTEQFWETINSLGDSIMVIDIDRPSDERINSICCDDPIYKQDVVNSLRAAYTSDEVKNQIKKYNYNIMTVEPYSKLIVYHTK